MAGLKTFDPDEYLNSNPADLGGFDPDAYLGQSQAQPVAAEPVQMPKPDASGYQAILPRTYQADVKDGAGLGRQALAAGLDVLSLPGRAIAASVEHPVTPFGYAGASYFPQSFGQNIPRSGVDPKQGQDYLNSLSDTEGSNIAGKIIRDPALIPGMATGAGIARGVLGAGLKGAKALSTIGAIGGAQSAAIHQADNLAQGREMSPLSAAGEVVAGAALPMVPKVLAKGARFVNKALGRLAQEFSGVSEEALRKYGTGFGQGAKDLAAAAGKQHEIGQKLVGVLDNLDDYLPEKDIVNKALEEIPPVNIGNAIETLRKAKTSGVLSSSKAINDKIDGIISDLAGAADEAGNVSASKFRNIRKEIDELAGDAFGKESGKFVSALKQTRHTMADDLVQSAEQSGIPEYADAMRSMSQKFRAADDLKSFLGKSAKTRENRAESFVSTLFGKNKTERQEAVKQIEALFGGDFIAESKLANLAAELGDEGKAGLLPRQFTGRAALGPITAAAGGSAGLGPAAGIPLALSSPKIASGALATSGAISRFLNKGEAALDSFGAKGGGSKWVQGLAAKFRNSKTPEEAAKIGAALEKAGVPKEVIAQDAADLFGPENPYAGYQAEIPYDKAKPQAIPQPKAKPLDPMEGMYPGNKPTQGAGDPGFDGMLSPEEVAKRQAQAQADREAVVRQARPVRVPQAKEAPGGVQVLDQNQIKKQPYKPTIEKSPPKQVGQSRIGFLEANNRRIRMTQYIKETKGYAPTMGEVNTELKKLGDQPVPKIPQKEVVSRQFKGRRVERDLNFLADALPNGTPGYETKAVPVKEAPEIFTLHGEEFKKVKGGWDNLITYRDSKGRKYEFMGNEKIHMDPINQAKIDRLTKLLEKAKDPQTKKKIEAEIAKEIPF